MNWSNARVWALCATGFAGLAAGCVGQPDSPRNEAEVTGASERVQQPKVVLVAAPDSASLAPPAFVPDDVGHKRIIGPFLKAHCLKCHGPDRQEAGFRTDQHLANDFLTRSVAERWSDVLNKLNAGEMPPDKEPQPPAAEVAKVVDWISRERLRGEKARRGTEIVLRRLNRAEYNNTIRDLTGVDMQPADEFPADPPAGGFDNNGAALTISPLQLDLYVRAARQVLDRAIVTQQERPPSIKWRFQMDEGNEGKAFGSGVPPDQSVNIDGRRMFINPGNNAVRDGLTVFRRPPGDTSGDARFGFFKVPHPGYYVVRMRAAGVVPPPDEVLRVATEIHERHQQEQESKTTDPEQRRVSREGFERHNRVPIQEHFSSRQYRFGPPRIKITNLLGGTARILAEFDVPAPESDPAVYEARAWFEPVEGTWVTVNNVYHIPRNN